MQCHFEKKLEIRNCKRRNKMKNKSILFGHLRIATIVFASLLIGAAAGVTVNAKTQLLSTDSGNVAPVLVASSTPITNGDISFGNGFAPIISKVVPAIVNVASTKVIKNPQANSPFFSDPLFRQFFGNQFPQQFEIPKEQRERGLGSGVIVSPDGYMLTNNHVVDSASEIQVSLADKREFKAKVVGTDPRTDVAVLKIDAINLPTVVLGDSSKIQVGNFVLAIGNPFGLSQTVTAGIISATGRGNLGIEDYEDFIQTDASINPGNSGGALINVNGELIGINTAILTGDGSRGNQGVGFAIPINMARSVMDQILNNGRVIRGYLGAWIQPVTPEIAKAFGLNKSQGALLGDVSMNGPAGKSGLQRGDIILEMNGQPIRETKDFRLKIAMTAPGTVVHLKVFRKGETRDYDVALGELPSEENKTGEEGGSPGTSLQGLHIETLTPEIADSIGLPAGTKGVVVDGVDPGSAAAEVGLRRGDVIQEVNHQLVTSLSDFSRLIRQSGNESVLLLVNRGGNTLYVAIDTQ
jgi:serine protease Do